MRRWTYEIYSKTLQVVHLTLGPNFNAEADDVNLPGSEAIGSRLRLGWTSASLNRGLGDRSVSWHDLLGPALSVR